MRSKAPPTTCPVCAGAVTADRFGVVACRTNATHNLREWQPEVRSAGPKRYYGVAATQHGGWFYSQPCPHTHSSKTAARACAERLARAKNRSAGILQGRQIR